jgi:hypothetical protein
MLDATTENLLNEIEFGDKLSFFKSSILNFLAHLIGTGWDEID